MGALETCLASLSSSGRQLAELGEEKGSSARREALVAAAGAVDTAAIHAARKLADSSADAKDFWALLPSQGVVLADVSRALADVMWLAPENQAMQAALLLTCLLRAPSCPALSLLDRRACDALLKLLRGVALGGAAGGGSAAPAKTSKAAKDQARGNRSRSDEGPEDMEVDDGGSEEEAGQVGGRQAGSNDKATAAAAMFEDVAGNFAAVLGAFSLKGQAETVQQVAETFAEASRAPRLPAGAATACFDVLLALLMPLHGSMLELSATVLRLLTPNLLAVSGGGAKAALPGRERVLELCRSALCRSPECSESVAALARHVGLRAPDKAEFRVAAVEAAVALMRLLPPDAQKQFVVFAARLSRTSKVSQRVMAVDLVPALLAAVDNPFAPVDLDHAPAAMGTATTLPCRTGGEPLVTSNTPATAAGARIAAPAMAEASGRQLVGAPWGTVCLAVLVQRCSDKAAVVRARALQNLAAVAAEFTSFHGGSSAEEARFLAALASAHEVNLQPQPMLGCTPGVMPPPLVSPAGTNEPGDTPMTLGENVPFSRTAATSTRRPARVTGGATRTCFTMPCLALGEAKLDAIIALARKRCSDEKGQARKAGLQLLEALLVMRAAGSTRVLPSSSDMAVLEAATTDVLVSVRKAALSATRSVLAAAPESAQLAALWIQSALPMIRDVETSLQELVLEQFQELLLARAAAAGSTSRDCVPTSAARKGAAELLPLLAALGAGGAASRACVARCISQLKAKQRLRAKQATAGLQRVIEAQVDAADSDSGSSTAPSADAITGAWLLYAEVAAADPAAPSWRFLQEQWEHVKADVAGQGAIGGGSAPASASAARLLRTIALAAAEFPGPQAQQLAAQLLQALHTFLLVPSAAAAHVAALAQLTMSHGDLAAAASMTQLLMAAEKVLAAYVESFQAGHAAAGGTMEGEAWQAAGALFTAGEVVLLQTARPSSRLVLMVQALTSSRLTAVAPQGAASSNSSSGGVDVPATVQAHAWVTLGKMCLADEALAKKCVPMFVQELERATLPAVRNNIMVALADLVMHFTALVDAHVGRLAACIRDPHELVRTQALALLSNLLQKDYVKWRGPLFHRFLLALVDDSPHVAGLAEYMLGDVLTTKLPNLAYNHFVEALFVLNDCQVGLHAGAAAAATMNDGAASTGHDTFCLRGPSPRMRAKRDAIYKALLCRMSPEHKFATAARLCQEVLGGVADSSLPLADAGVAEVLGDALRCLASKHIKVAAGRGAADDADEDAVAAVGAAKGRLVSQMMKKHLVEGVVPVVIELKGQLEAARHPLLGELMMAMRVILREHKNEIEDILVADRQLAKEILYDMRQDELAAKAARQGGATAVATIAEGRQPSKTPGPAPGSAPRLPAGTNASTPIAAQVLQTVRKPSRSPGGTATAQRLSKTPGRGHFLTPGTHGKAVAASGGPATLPRLARTAGPVVSPGLAMAPDNAGPASVPRLRSRSATAPGSSRLQPRGLGAPPSALEPTAAAAAGAIEEQEGHVALPFGVPPGPGAAAGRQWNVAPAVAPIDGGTGGQGGESKHESATVDMAAQPRQSSRSKRKA